MDQTTSRKLVLVSLGGMGVVAMARHVQGRSKGSTYRQVWAIGALGLLLATAADFIPQIAGPLALLVAMTYIAGGQDSLTALIHGAIGAPAAAGTTAVGGTPAPTTQNPRAGGHPGERPT